MSKFSRILETYKEIGDIIAIYRFHEDCENFLVGKVIHVSKEFYVLANIDIYGKADGFIFERLDEISRIEIGSKYIDNIKKVHVLEKAELSMPHGDNVIDELLEYLKANTVTCTIELEECDLKFVGNFGKCEHGLVHFNQFGNYGNTDGVLIFDKDSILTIHWNTKDELFVDLLKVN